MANESEEPEETYGSSENDDESIGYKKPPHWTRWQKGQSGNPAGRKKKAKPTASVVAQDDLDDILRSELNRRLSVREGGNTLHLSAIAVIHRAMVNQAAGKGDIRAQREVVNQARELAARDKARAEDQRRLEAKVLSHFIALKRSQTKLWDAAAMEGREPQHPWPHPDDLVIDEGRGTWSIRGPMGPEDVPYFEGLRAIRDQYFARMFIAMREGKKSAFTMRVAAIFWPWFDQMLPKRWQVFQDYERMAVVMLNMPMRTLRHVEGEANLKAQAHERAYGRPAKESYPEVNSIMKPILADHGYRSLREFETAYARDGDAMVCPKPGSPAALRQ